MTSILRVDDETAPPRTLPLNMRSPDHGGITADTGGDALSFARAAISDVVALGLRLPDIPGVEVLRRLRPRRTVPVIVLPARRCSDKVQPARRRRGRLRHRAVQHREAGCAARAGGAPGRVRHHDPRRRSAAHRPCPPGGKRRATSVSTCASCATSSTPIPRGAAASSPSRHGLLVRDPDPAPVPGSGPTARGAAGTEHPHA